MNKSTFWYETKAGAFFWNVPALYVSPEIANLYSSFPVREDMQSITPATIAKPLSKYNRLIPECVTCQLFATKIVSIIRWDETPIVPHINNPTPIIVFSNPIPAFQIPKKDYRIMLYLNFSI